MMAGGSNTTTIDPKRKRARHSKTRNGCARCKQRHIKCDETKPSCERCLQANLPCPGYVEVPVRTKRTTVQRFRIIPDPHTSSIAPANRHSGSESPWEDIPFRKPTSTPLKEQSAIDFFTSQTLPTMNMYSPDSELWTTAAFTRLTADAKIRNAVIAIGLAHQALRRNQRRAKGPTSSLHVDRDESLSIALDCDRYYNAALAYMQVDVSWVKENTTADRLSVTVACLLLVIYLSLRDRMEEAAVHLHCGLDIVCEGGKSFILASTVHRETYLYFLRLATNSWPRHPSPALFSLIQSSSALSCYLTDLTPLQSLESSFDFYSHRLFRYVSSVTRGNTTDPTQLAAMKVDLVEEAQVLFDKIDDYADIVGVSEDAHHDTETLDLMFIRLLRARLLIFRLFTLAVGTRYQTTYDRYTADFEEAITLIGRACKTGSNLVAYDWSLFSINLNILGIIGQTVMLCRHPVLRRKALAVFDISPQREGLLSATEGKQVCQMTIDFEEQGVDMLSTSSRYPTIIPEESRLHFIEPMRRSQYQGSDVADNELLVRMMYRPNGDAGYVERRVKVKRDLAYDVQRTIAF